MSIWIQWLLLVALALAAIGKGAAVQQTPWVPVSPIQCTTGVCIE